MFSVLMLPSAAAGRGGGLGIPLSPWVTWASLYASLGFSCLIYKMEIIPGKSFLFIISFEPLFSSPHQGIRDRQNLSTAIPRGPAAAWAHSHRGPMSHLREQVKEWNPSASS